MQICDNDKKARNFVRGKRRNGPRNGGMDQGMVGLKREKKGATTGEKERRSVGAVVGAAKAALLHGAALPWLTPTGGP